MHRPPDDRPTPGDRGDDPNDLRAEERLDDETQRSNVEHVLARQFKSLRTGERLGFPAFDAHHDLLGFFRELSSSGRREGGDGGNGGGKTPEAAGTTLATATTAGEGGGVRAFIPLFRYGDEFGPEERDQASMILRGAMDATGRGRTDPALHSLADWGSVANLVDHALVYDWSKGMRGASSSPIVNGDDGSDDARIRRDVI